MLGHAEEWFYRGLGGINVDLSAKEARQLILRPQLVGKLTSVQTRYVSALGPVESFWKRGPAQTEYALTIPANAVATVQLTSSTPESLTIDGTVPDKASGVISARIESDRIELVLGSGHYHISAPNPTGKR